MSQQLESVAGGLALIFFCCFALAMTKGTKIETALGFSLIVTIIVGAFIGGFAIFAYGI